MTNLQQKYHEILKSIKHEKEDLKDIDDRKIDYFITQTNLLFSNVSTPIELKLDARISAEAVNLSSVYFEKKLRNRKITTQKFIEHLNKSLNTNTEENRDIYINKLNIFFKDLTKKYYGIKFMEFQTIGEIQQRKPREIKANDEHELETTQVSQCNMKDDTFMAKIYKIVNLIGNQKIDYFRAVLDPNSFTKTIENMFTLSFAIKMKKILLSSDDDGNFLLSRRISVDTSQNATEDETASQDNELNHFSSTIDYKEYKLLLGILDIDKSFINI